MNTRVDRTSGREGHEERDLSAQAPPLARDGSLMRGNRLLRITLANQPLWPWLKANTFAPPWLPTPWCRLLIGYLVAVLLELGAVNGTHFMVHTGSVFALQALLILLGIVVVALNWGAGPGLLAIVVSMAQLSVFVLFPWFPSSQHEMVQGVCVLVSWLIGCSICVLVSQSAGARRHAEELARSLRKEQARSDMERQRLRTLLGVLPSAVAMVDAQGRFLELNPAHQALWGAEPLPGELAHLQAHQGWWPDTGRPLAAGDWAIARALTRGETILNEEVEELLDGQRKVMLHSAAPIRDATGMIHGAAGILHDVTEQRRLQQQTRDALHALLAMAEALVQVHDAPHDAAPSASTGAPAQREGVDPGLPVVAHRLAELTRRVLECQSVSVVAVEHETGDIHPVTIVGLSSDQEARWWAGWDRAYRLSDHVNASTLAALQAGEPVTLAPTYLPFRQRRDFFPACASLLVPMQMGGSLVGILKVDGGASERNDDEVTGPNQQALIRAVARLGALVLDRERLLRQRAQALASELALREANQHMDTFVGMASHELKTPLTSMKLCLYLAERRVQHMIRRATSVTDVATDGESVLEQVAFAERQTERLDRLVNDLLDVSRVRAGKLELQPAPADLTAIVHEALEEQRQAAPARSLLLQSPADLYVPVTADAGRIGQVVTNYLTNALKYSPADRPVTVGIAVEGQQARVWVRDEGPGLPAEEQERVWERFHRAKGIEVQSGSGIGLGLGLHICRTIIERHQGQVGIESVPGQGSTFWFTLPLARDESDD